MIEAFTKCDNSPSENMIDFILNLTTLAAAAIINKTKTSDHVPDKDAPTYFEEVYEDAK